jgi:hypothetical protein
MLLFGCAAIAGSVDPAFTGVYSSSYSPYQNELVGYDTVSSVQTGTVASCGGAGTYGTQIDDALVAHVSATYAGVGLFVRNTGTVPARLVSVYVTDSTSNTLALQASTNVVLNVGQFVEIPPSTLNFSPVRGDNYTFFVTSSVGTSTTYHAEAA